MFVNSRGLEHTSSPSLVPTLVALCGACVGKCEKEIEKYCKELEQGEGKLADCMSDIISEIENPEIGDRKYTPAHKRTHTFSYTHARVHAHVRRGSSHVCCVVGPCSVGTGDPLEVSDDCREEVYQFKITRSKNINYNIPLGELTA